MAGRSRNVLRGVVVALVIFAGVVAWNWRKISLLITVLRASRPPATAFDQTPAPPAPDYASPASWAALPDKKDDADVLTTADPKDGQATARVDVFFLHPTTYFSSKSWNQWLDDKDPNELVDQDILRNQASVFNGCCRVFAPRYRQASLGSQAGAEAEMNKAFDLAYRDVQAAFDYYLKHYNNGRPFILAGHSQGTMHAMRLLVDSISGKPIAQQLVAAYLVGMPIPTDFFTRATPELPLCTSPEQARCAVTWNTIGPSADPSGFLRLKIHYPSGLEPIVGKTISCVNPLTWKADEAPADKSLNLGGVRFPMASAAPVKPDAALVEARCKQGWLVISTPAIEAYKEILLGPDIYHLYDFSLFYMNIRQNVQARVDTFLKATAPASQPTAEPAPH